MSFAATAVLTCLATVLLGLAATHPHELRAHRWLKIALSLPIVVLIASQFYQIDRIGGFFAMWGFGLLALIWKSPLAHFGACCVGRLIYGNMNGPTGVQPDFFGPKALRKHGDLEEAIRLTRQELEKDPLSYEGWLLLSDLHLENRQAHRALNALEKLATARLTDDQREEVRARREQIEAKLLVAELNAG